MKRTVMLFVIALSFSISALPALAAKKPGKVVATKSKAKLMHPEDQALQTKMQKNKRSLRILMSDFRKSSTDSDRIAITDHLKKILGRQFDLRQERKALKYERMQRRLSRLKEELDRDGEQRDGFVRHWSKRLLAKRKRRSKNKLTEIE